MVARLAAALLAALVLAPAAAQAAWPSRFPAVAGNPANRLARLPIEPPTYDPATRCTPKRKAGTEAMVAWLQRNADGVFWGTYRCEKWGRRSASLHAENRAIDWHLNAWSAADRRAANRLIGLLLAPDRAGEPQALARRMGVEELIWDCRYWGAGMPGPTRYSACFTERGRPRRGLDATTAHRDHIHIGLTVAGSLGRTSFWTRRAAR